MNAIIINTPSPATQAAPQAMTQEEIREFFAERQTALSRDYFTDLAILENQIKARGIKFQHDADRLEAQQAAAMRSAEAQHKAAHHLKP